MEELFGHQSVTTQDHFSLRTYHPEKSTVGRTPKHDIRRYFFSERIVLIWNELPDVVISAHNLATFKSRLNTTDLRKLKFVTLTVKD